MHQATWEVSLWLIGMQWDSLYFQGKHSDTWHLLDMVQTMYYELIHNSNIRSGSIPFDDMVFCEARLLAIAVI